MKKLCTLFILAFLLPLQAFAVEQWEEGKHYTVLDKPATEKPEIREYFSFWCPACFGVEPLIAQIKEKMPEDVSFNKVHVNFMRFTTPEIQDAATRAMVIARAVKQEDKLNAAIFNAIHRQRTSITGLDDLRSIFIANGVDAAEFDKLAASFGVNSMLKKNNMQINDYRNYINGVPNFIVNGKYQAQFTRNMTTDDIINLLVWLSQQP
ncbi:thiol:disulfide interchange protein DsbA/DsbL [Alteromonas sediminis]|uniref:Thiol:disulfide interchange protein n=1 Tax=Alteromonas sediminis TaxID=2259342 RepID=A0A3N5XYD7_9ALTE|nr:thiol:disulfide interchange protein DsbA/DsbL [Alteromonas sediminis]RPJ65992.1 thiol:disulfide interchange protein DsbA/DsbL [Alteromonas sediminis]